LLIKCSTTNNICLHTLNQQQICLNMADFCWTVLYCERIKISTLIFKVSRIFNTLIYFFWIINFNCNCFNVWIVKFIWRILLTACITEFIEIVLLMAKFDSPKHVIQELYWVFKRSCRHILDSEKLEELIINILGKLFIR